MGESDYISLKAQKTKKRHLVNKYAKKHKLISKNFENSPMTDG